MDARSPRTGINQIISRRTTCLFFGRILKKGIREKIYTINYFFFMRTSRRIVAVERERRQAGSRDGMTDKDNEQKDTPHNAPHAR